MLTSFWTLAVLSGFATCSAWIPSPPSMTRTPSTIRIQQHPRRALRLESSTHNVNDANVDSDKVFGDSLYQSNTRRDLLWSLAPPIVVSTGTVLAWNNVHPLVANALVKGVSPPPPKSSVEGGRPKCTNVEECQAAAELKEQQERERQEANQVPASIAAKGTRYRDIELGNENDGKNARVVKVGDEVTVYYKVLKLGKRSYDGLSGEGTVVFSRGYGYEDDEDRPRQKSWTTTVGALSNIGALNDAILGMRVSGIRRIVVLPEQGWRKPGRQCDGGPGGSGAGGDLKTDYVVVPTATMVATEACLDASKQPYPTSFAQQRRMAQRFDQSLILEVEVVKIATGDSSLL